MKKIKDHLEVMEILKDELPQCFKRGDKKLPLAVGIHSSILKHYLGDDRFDDATLKKAVGLYCRGAKYIKSIVEGAPRIDINGLAISTVRKSEELYALKILSDRRQKTKNTDLSA